MDELCSERHFITLEENKCFGYAIFRKRRRQNEVFHNKPVSFACFILDKFQGIAVVLICYLSSYIFIIIIIFIVDVFLPCPDNLLVNLAESRELVKYLLNQLPSKFPTSHDTNSALGAALQAAYKLMVSYMFPS
jgi:hypothetical protein